MKKTFAPPVCIDYRAPVITSTRSARWHNFFSGKFPLKMCGIFLFLHAERCPATHTPHQIPRRKTMRFHLRENLRERTAAQRIFRRHKRVGSRPLASGEITPQRIQSKRMDCSGNRTSHRNRSLHRMVIPLPKH